MRSRTESDKTYHLKYPREETTFWSNRWMKTLNNQRLRVNGLLVEQSVPAGSVHNSNHNNAQLSSVVAHSIFAKNERKDQDAFTFLPKSVIRSNRTQNP